MLTKLLTKVAQFLTLKQHIMKLLLVILIELKLHNVANTSKLNK